MIPISINAENYMSYKKLNLPLEEMGVYFVLGENKDDIGFSSNGSGKSSGTVDALSFALFGKTTREKMPVDEIINDIENKNLKIEYMFKIGKNSYKIQRYRKHDNYKNEVYLYKNSIEDTNLYESQKDIDKVIGFDYKMFLDFIAIGQETQKMFASRTDKEMSDSLEKFLHFDVYDNAYREAHDKVKVVKAEQLQIEKEILKVQERIDKSLEGLTAFENGVKENSEKLEAEIEEKHKTGKELKELKEVISGFEEDIVEIIRKAENKMHLQEMELKTKENNILLLNNQIDSIKNRIIKKGQQCPVCERITEKDIISASEVNKLTKAIEGRKDLNIKILKEKEEIKDRRNEITGLYNKKKEQEKLVQIKNKILELEIRYSNQKIRISDLKEHLSGYQKLLSKKKKEIKSMKDELKSVLNSKEEKEKVINIYEYLKTTFKEIKSLLLNKTFNFLNARLREYNDQLCFGRYSLYFKKTPSLKTKFMIFDNLKRKEYSYFKYSGGEKGRYNVSMCLSLQDLFINKIGIRFFDDVFGSIDEEGIINVCQLLRGLSGMGFVICQRDFSDYFAMVLKATKEKGESKICII